MPDYAAIAAKHGGTVSTPQSGVDYAALAAKHGGTVSQTQTQQPTATMQARPNTLSNWFEDVGNDIKHGTTITGPGKFLHTIGVQPTYTGEPGGSPANLIGNALVGLTQVGHAATEPSMTTFHSSQIHPHKAVQDINELIKGGTNIAAPGAAVAAPEALIPYGATYGLIGAGVTKAASALGADPDTAELAGNVAMLATPGIKKSLPAVGKFVEKNAPAIGKTAGYGGAAYEVATHPTPTNAVMGLLGAHPLARATEAVTGAIGRGMQHVGNAPILPHEIGGFSAPQGGNNDIVRTASQFADAQHFAHNSLGIDLEPNMAAPPDRSLGPGPTEMPAPPEEPAPLIRTPASQIVRGQGGRMTRQYLTGEAQPGAPTQFGAQPPVLPGLGESQAPPPFNPSTAVTDTSTGVSSPAETKPLIQVPQPSTESSPLTNDTKSPIINNEESNVSNPTDMSRRQFLGLGAKAAASTVMPKGVVGDLINTAIGGESPSMGVGNAPVSSTGAENWVPAAISKLSDYIFNHSMGSMNPAVREAFNQAGLTDEAIKSGNYTTKQLDSAQKILEDISEDYEAMSNGEEGNGAWEKYDLGGDDDVDYNSSHPFGALEALRAIKQAPNYQKALDGIRESTDLDSYLEQAGEDFRDNHGRDPDSEQELLDEQEKYFKDPEAWQQEQNARIDQARKSDQPIPQEKSDVLPGDFSLNTPQRFYHGSDAPNLINTGLEGRIPSDVYEGIRDNDNTFESSNPESYRGSYLSPNPEVSEGYGKVHSVDLPRGASMRIDPDEDQSLIHRGDIPSGRVNTQDDLIDTHGFQQEGRDNLDRGQESADELAKKIQYKGNKPGYSPTLPGEDGNTDLLPWAQTPWGSNEGLLEYYSRKNLLKSR